jgi:hypothetical protein
LAYCSVTCSADGAGAGVVGRHDGVEDAEHVVKYTMPTTADSSTIGMLRTSASTMVLARSAASAEGPRATTVVVICRACMVCLPM